MREEESEEREKEEEVGSFQVIDYPIRWSLGQPPLETSTTGLSATLSERHIVDADSLSIICTASLGPSYRRSTSVTAAVFKSVPPQQQHKQQQQPPQVKPSIDKRRSAHTLTGFVIESTLIIIFQHLFINYYSLELYSYHLLSII